MKKKLGISQIEINKKFASRDEAFKYAKRLREFIRYTCKKNASIGWQAQAMIVVSNIKGNTSSVYYEQNGQAHKPRKARRSWEENNVIDWHIHILLVSMPSYAFRDVIKNYIDKNWIDLPNVKSKKISGKKKVYKKNANINIAEYFIDQNVDILFCNYNYTNNNLIPKGYTLKNLYKAYMKSRTTYHYCRKYFNNWDKKLKIDNDYQIIKNFYYELSREQDEKEANVFMKKVQINKISENYGNLQNISRRRSEDTICF